MRDIKLTVGQPVLADYGPHNTRKLVPGPEGDTIVTHAHVDAVTSKLAFGEDNRAALPAELHRISAMRDRGKNIYALSMRVGREITGTTNLLTDLLF